MPSGTLWATCNIGANSPEEYGDYFAWGETAPKDDYNWSNYKWCNGVYQTPTKYCDKSYAGYNGFVDNKTELDPEDDAACVNWGPSWRMPTTEQEKELYEKCSSSWTVRDGVNGRLFIGPNGNILFLPAALEYAFVIHVSVICLYQWHIRRAFFSFFSPCNGHARQAGIHTQVGTAREHNRGGRFFVRDGW